MKVIFEILDYAKEMLSCADDKAEFFLMAMALSLTVLMPLMFTVAVILVAKWYSLLFFGAVVLFYKVTDRAYRKMHDYEGVE